MISITNKRHSFSNLRCNAANLKTPLTSYQLPVTSYQKGSFFTGYWTLSTVNYSLCFLFLALCLSCAIPESEVAQHGSAPVTEKGQIEILPSNRERKPLPIVGVSYVKTIGTPGQGAGEFQMPLGLAIDEADRIYIADAGNNRVQVIDATGNYITEFGGRGWQTGEFDHPSDIALSFQRSYRHLYVADTRNNRVQYCNFVDQIFYPLNQSIEGTLLDQPEGIGIGRNGEVYVVDTGNHRWIEFNVTGVPVVARGSFGGGPEQLWNPTDLGVDTHGNVYVVDTGNHLIKKYDFSGNPIRAWGGEGDTRGHLREPKCIALDDWNYLYVTDSGNRRIQVFAPDGKSITEFTTPTLLEPIGIAISKSERVFVSDAEANNIKVFQVFRKK